MKPKFNMGQKVTYGKGVDEFIVSGIYNSHNTVSYEITRRFIDCDGLTHELTVSVYYENALGAVNSDVVLGFEPVMNKNELSEFKESIKADERHQLIFYKVLTWALVAFIIFLSKISQ